MSAEQIIALGALVGIAATVAGGLYSLIKSGRAEGRREARLAAMDDKLALHSRYHGDHFQHAKDLDIHWTSRERDALNHRMDRQDEKQEEILREIRSLGERMYDK